MVNRSSKEMRPALADGTSRIPTNNVHILCAATRRVERRRKAEVEGRRKAGTREGESERERERGSFEECNSAGRSVGGDG